MGTSSGDRQMMGFKARAKRRSWVIFAVVAAVTACAVPPPGAPVWVHVPEEASLALVADTLEAYGIVTSARRFERFARMGRRDRGIKPGIYEMRPGRPMGRVLATLRRGAPAVSRVNVRERMTLVEFAEFMHDAVGFDPDEVLEAAHDPDLIARVGADGPTIEGYLYPTAYFVRRTTPVVEVLAQMADTFEARWDTTWNARLDTLGVTRHELVILASIIAGEMPHPSERHVVSSVYHNRLKRGMRLQADPTVVYALGERRRLTFRDYRVDSEYNTYRIDGLPPGPIGQPSVASIHAALYPADTDYLYFVGGWNRRHIFSSTYREHLRTIRQIRGTR